MPTYKVVLHETRAYMGTVEAPNRTEALNAAVKAAKTGKLNKLPETERTWAAPIFDEVDEK